MPGMGVIARARHRCGSRGYGRMGMVAMVGHRCDSRGYGRMGRMVMVRHGCGQISKHGDRDL